MSNATTKLALRESFRHKCEEEGIYFRDVDDIRFLTKCPYCGDSDDPRHAHFYVIADPSNNMNAGFVCHKCGEHGPVTEDTLLLFGIDDVNLRNGLITLNKTSDKKSKHGYMEGTELKTFPFEVKSIARGRKVGYLEQRLKRNFTDQELKEMKVVTSLHRFLIENQIDEMRFDKWFMNLLERDYIGFLTYGNSHILFRDITNTHDERWVKYPIISASASNKVLYTIQTEIDPMTTEEIEINIAEGIMDTLSICYNLGHRKSNTLNVCVGGNYFEKFLVFLLDLGFAGSNVTINIFADNDMRFNQKAKKQTDLAFFNRTFHNFKYLYKEINVYYNLIGKDCGVPKEEIRLKRYRL